MKIPSLFILNGNEQYLLQEYLLFCGGFCGYHHHHHTIELFAECVGEENVSTLMCKEGFRLTFFSLRKRRYFRPFRRDTLFLHYFLDIMIMSRKMMTAITCSFLVGKFLSQHVTQLPSFFFFSYSHFSL